MRIPARIIAALVLAAIAQARGGEQAEPVRHRITGLFAPSREQALREAAEKIPGLALVRLDFDDAEADFAYDPKALFPGAKPEQVVERLDQRLRAASGHTLGVKPLCDLPRERRERVEVKVAGLDCPACALAAYEAVERLDGVAAATVSFRAGRLVARVDPAKVDRAKIEATLKQRGVDVVAP